MANYRNSLSALLEALQAGLSPSAGASELQNLVSQRDAARQARQEQMSSLMGNLLGIAQSGQPLDAAQTYLSSLSAAGLVRPRMASRLEQATNTAYGRPTLSNLGNPIPESQVYSPLAPPAAPVAPDVLDDEDQGALWTDIVTMLQAGSSPFDLRAPTSVVSQLSLKYGPLLTGHEQEVMGMIQQALAVLGERAPANVRMAERGY